jgi:hypothetical protein
MEQDKVNFLDGLAYCELRGAYTKKYGEDDFMVSKKGDPMIMLKWSVTDKQGNTGDIKDYITSAMKFKIQNLCNVLKIRNLYDEVSGKFDVRAVSGRNCCAVIKKEENDQYGSKIIKYIPIAYSEMVDSGKDFQASTARSERVQNQVENIKHDLKAEAKKHTSASTFSEELTDDDYPF